MSFVAWVAALAVVTALACALPGVFVVLRRSAMLTDAISHAVFPGIVVGYFFTRNLDSPWLIIGAALAGLVVIIGGEYLAATQLVPRDASQGLLFPALFSAGVILVSLNFGDMHLDTDVVLVGDLNLAAFRELTLNGVTVGPTYFYLMAAVLVVNAVFIAVFYRQLVTTTFDPSFAHSIGMPVRGINTAFMFLVSLTITAAFNGAGAVLAVALVVAPAATAQLLTSRLPVMIGLTMLIAGVGALGGFGAAYVLNTATSASMSVFYGLIFAVALGTTRWRERAQQTRSIEQQLVV